MSTLPNDNGPAHTLHNPTGKRGGNCQSALPTQPGAKGTSPGGKRDREALSTDVERTWRGDPAELVAAMDEDPRSLLRQLVPPAPHWHAYAACRGVPVDLFFPGPGTAPREALEICGRCTVRTECLAEALADPTLDHGIRGGMTARARARARVRRGEGVTS